MLKKNIKKIHFDLSGYYFLGLIPLILTGFWTSYFVKFFDGTGNFSFYFHFHAILLVLWLSALIIQPILIRKKKLDLHRFIGKLTYLIFPLVFISVILLAHCRPNSNERSLSIGLFVACKDLLILAVAYFIAIWFRHDVQLHARGMVVTGLVYIEPALIRLIYTITHSDNSYYYTIGILYSIFLLLIFLERKQKKARWIFPLILSIYIVVHTIIVSGIEIPFWTTIVRWFMKLPIT